MAAEHVPVSDVSEHGSGEPTGRVRRRRSRSDRARADIRAGLLQLSQAVLRVQADVANRVSIQYLQRWIWAAVSVGANKNLAR